MSNALLRNKRKPRSTLSTVPLHMMLLPGVIIVFIYSYLPMAGLVMAFQKFDIYKGIEAFWTSEWVGLGNYTTLLRMGEPIRVLRNTVVIAFLKLTCGFLVPVLVALMLNELRLKTLKRSVQTIVYMPHFISWVLLAGVIRQIFSADGIINNFLTMNLGLASVPFLSSNDHFVPLLIGTNIWKEFGFGTIVYLAAITNADPALYEAAIMDGANRLKQTWHVTLPAMQPIIVLTLVLSLQNVLNAGFDQIFNLYNSSVYRSADIIDTWVYRISFESTTPMYSLGAAVGLFKSVVSLVFISSSYYLAHRFANYQIF
ncbi:MAG: ABC transporter permease subunit [Oscillospiraceae bacterium]|nr:ABC transporter permease subunit [Oscillospiraceae bacterium]